MNDYTSRVRLAKTLLSITGNSEDQVLLALFQIAGAKILERAYPFGTSLTDVPERWQMKQVEIVVYLFNKRGAEGQTAHSESGVSRTYGSADVPEELLRGIAPMVGLPE